MKVSNSKIQHRTPQGIKLLRQHAEALLHLHIPLHLLLLVDGRLRLAGMGGQAHLVEMQFVLQVVDLPANGFEIVFEMADLLFGRGTAFHALPVFDRLLEDAQLIDEEVQFGNP